jgi:hypothetical protein
MQFWVLEICFLIGIIKLIALVGPIPCGLHIQYLQYYWYYTVVKL